MNNQLETIERYLSNEMDQEESSRFEQRIMNDSALAEEVEKTRVYLSELKAFEKRSEFKRKLEQIHSSMEEGKVDKPKSGKVIRMNSYFQSWWAAASVVLLVGLGIFSYLKLTKDSDKAQYQELRTDLERIQQTQKKLWKALKEEGKTPGSKGFGGTAFAISSDGYLVTSYHVVKEAAVVYVQNEKYHRLKAKCVYTKKDLDIAILKVDDRSFASFGKIPYSFGLSSKGLGSEVYTLGYPKEDIVYGEGYVSSLSGYDGDTTSYQMAIPVNPGNSGGPILDNQGNIVGIIKGKHREEEGAAFALKTKYLKGFLKTLKKERVKLPKGGVLIGKSKVGQIKKVQPFVFQIQVYE